jgi:ABC-2 type transport system ATP-binding protein
VIWSNGRNGACTDGIFSETPRLYQQGFSFIINVIPKLYLARGNLIKIQGISKQYKQITVLDNVSFSLQKGRVLGILGPNGAGKSTLLKILALVLDPDAGSYSLDNTDALKYAKTLHPMIGYVPQDLALYEDLSVLDNMIYWSNTSWRQSRSRVNQLLAEFELESLSAKRVSTLSGGMKRRLNLAVAMINSPQVLIMDEPMVGVDIVQLTLMRAYLSSLAKDGITQVITSHTASAVLEVLDDVMIMNKGKIKFFDTVAGFMAACDNDLQKVDETIIKIMNS